MRTTHLLFLIALLSLVLGETTFYLSPYGSDDNNGDSPDTPFLTFGKVINATESTTGGLVIYVYPGVYGGVNNTALNYTGPLTINWKENTTAEEGASTSVQFDCTAAATLPCLFSNTSITVNGLDDSENPQIIFSDCSTCLSVDNTENKDDINGDYVLSITGVTFSEVSQAAVVGLYLETVDITSTSFSDVAAGGLTLVSLIGIEKEITIQSSNFTSLNKNALTIVNTTTTEVQDCYFSNSYIAITGLDEDSHAVLGPNTYTANAGATDYVITLSTGTFTVKDSKVNTQGIGSVKVTTGVTASIINSTFENAAAENGGSLYFENVTTVTISEGCFFSSNAATIYGGAVYLVNSEAHLDNTNFTLNSAVDGAAIGCTGNDTTVTYDNTTVFFYQNTNRGGVNATDIQNTCNVEIGSFQSSLVKSSLDDSSTWWIWLLVSLAVLVVILIIVAAVGFVIYQRKRQSYTRMD